MVMPHVEWATNTVQRPSVRPALSIAFCAYDVTSMTSPSPRVSSVSSSQRACIECLPGRPRCGPRAQSTVSPTGHDEGRTARGRTRVTQTGIPGVPEALLAPLLDTVADRLREVPPADVPLSLRPLLGFDRRGLSRGAARQQLLRALETEGGFRKQMGE